MPGCGHSLQVGKISPEGRKGKGRREKQGLSKGEKKQKENNNEIMDAYYFKICLGVEGEGITVQTSKPGNC